MKNETLRQDDLPAAAAAEARAPQIGNSADAFKAMMQDENGQAMVEYVIMLPWLVAVAFFADFAFAQLIEGRMKLTWVHIIYPFYFLDPII